MLDDKEIVVLKNISDGVVFYDLPELNLKRTYEAGSIKKVPANEVRVLNYQAGGYRLLQDYLSLDNEELCEELGLDITVEYHWSAEDVKDLLLNGSLDRLKDALDFAPLGIVELIKTLAVELEITDLTKREAIHSCKRAKYYDVTAAIKSLQIETPKVVEVQSSGAKQRRVPVEEPVVSTPSKYSNIVVKS